MVATGWRRVPRRVIVQTHPQGEVLREATMTFDMFVSLYPGHDTILSYSDVVRFVGYPRNRTEAWVMDVPRAEVFRQHAAQWRPEPE